MAKTAKKRATKGDKRGYVTVAIKMHAEQADIVYSAAEARGVSAAEMGRDVLLKIACKETGFEAPDLPPIRSGRTSPARIAAEKAGMTLADFKKKAIADASKAALAE